MRYGLVFLANIHDCLKNRKLINPLPLYFWRIFSTLTKVKRLCRLSWTKIPEMTLAFLDLPKKLPDSQFSSSFEMERVVTLVHPDATLQVPASLLVHKCDLFSDDPGLTALPYHLKSQISLSDFRAFVSALDGTRVKITNNNFQALMQLCEEFEFGELGVQLSQFRESDDFKEDAVLLSALKKHILAMEEQIQDGKREIASLRGEVSRQSEIQKLFEMRVRTEAESATRRANEAQKNVADVQSGVDHLRCELKEVRKTAENAREIALLSQNKAESTKARPEAAVSAPRTTFPRSAVPPLPLGWNSAIVACFPKLFEDFKTKTFILLWRGSRDGFAAHDFHSHCDRHANTLTVILDTDGNIFGGFTPVEWESRDSQDSANWFKADPSLKSFLFTLKNPHNVAERRFALNATEMDRAINCDSRWSPCFRDIGVRDNGNANTWSYTCYFGTSYINDTRLDGRTFFTGSQMFKVKEIEIFEITD
jgi:hypothetical protein